jgi:hypothetical protein
VSGHIPARDLDDTAAKIAIPDAGLATCDALADEAGRRRLVAGNARTRVQVRYTVDVKAETIVPVLRAHLDAHGLGVVQIVQLTECDAFPASRTDPYDAWARLFARSMHQTAGRPPTIIPNIGASGPSEYFKQVLGVSAMWIPHSYGGCGQHGPDEHGLGSLFRDGLGLMAGVFWDIGEQGRPA